MGNFSSKEIPKRLRLELNWDCRYGEKDCKPSLLRKFHNSAVNPSREKAEYRIANDSLYRDLYSAEGIEINITSKGRIRGFSIYLLILHLSLLCILLQATDLIVDFYASTCFSRTFHTDHSQFYKSKYAFADVPHESWAVLPTPSPSSSSLDDFL
jgi:hypothetical protein